MSRVSPACLVAIVLALLVLACAGLVWVVRSGVGSGMGVNG